MGVLQPEEMLRHRREPHQHSDPRPGSKRRAAFEARLVVSGQTPTCSAVGRDRGGNLTNAECVSAPESLSVGGGSAMRVICVSPAVGGVTWVGDFLRTRKLIDCERWMPAEPGWTERAGMVALAETGRSRKASPCLLRGGRERVNLALGVPNEECESSEALKVGTWLKGWLWLTSE